MIPFLNRNDEKWPHTRQIKIAGRNHILPPLGINVNYAKLVNPKATRACWYLTICFVKRFDYTNVLCSGVN
jgi:hypothetical protein